jgi:cardiolipin synthase
LYWRDTHVKIKGEAVYYLQYLFLGDWNFCANQRIAPSRAFFPEIKTTEIKGDKLVQIAASGPDSDAPTILYSLVQAISGAQKTLFITNPYFIPDESILVAMVIAARRGVDIKLLLPGTSDSKIVSAAARSYYSQLLIAGVEIYHYHKGFVHAKTLVADGEIAMVGTANLDIRSFNLNFEVNAIIYDNDFAQKLQKVFFEDLKDADKILSEDWQKRTVLQRLPEKIARLLSSIL